MKLIPLTLLTISLAVDMKAQNFRQQFPFPPQFQSPNSGIFSTDSSLYLPPEPHTALPYFPLKNLNNLQFPYLPPTGTKAPSIYPTPFPYMISSSLVPNFDDDDDDEEAGTIRMSTIRPPIQQKINYTEKAPDTTIKEKREMRPIPNMVFQQPIDRIDLRMPSHFPSPSPAVVTTPVPNHQTPAIRRMIISPETHRNDVSFDQIKAASFQANQFIGAPGVFISSTTEPAIPILRLSNEMDLDGSFSYEALGADQTHYVQHSRMENTGTDKEEQVVEGSYSYVGDNGQTYTVHYIADSNGFRASGDHLPVAPPVPEIIQRSIQFNLAEEAKRPPHLKNWQDDGKDNQISDSDKNQHFLPPPRNLFTGRTPEAFSYSYSQGSNTQNNLVTSASSQVPIRTIDISTEQTKIKANGGPISPQVTFLASQGAHLPSINTVQNSISRMYTTEKPNTVMTQLVNYEAAAKDSDLESSKSLWRWQYGINANNLSQNQNKDTISRSFGEGDDVMINFHDMTPEQYSNIMRSQFEASVENVGPNQYTQSHQINESNNNYANHNQNQNVNIQKHYHNQNQDAANNFINKDRSQIKTSPDNVRYNQYTHQQINDNQNNQANRNQIANIQKDYTVQNQNQNVNKMVHSQSKTSIKNDGSNQFTQIHEINPNNYHANHYQNQDANVQKSYHDQNFKNMILSQSTTNADNVESNQNTQIHVINNSPNNYHVYQDQDANIQKSHHNQNQDQNINNMIRLQLTSSAKNVGLDQYTQSHLINNNQNNYYAHHNKNQDLNVQNSYYDQTQDQNIENNKQKEKQTNISTEINVMPEDWYKTYNVNFNPQIQTSIKPIESRESIAETKPKLISQQSFAFPSQTVTQSYNFEDIFYEPRKIKSLNADSTTKSPMNNNNDISTNNVVTNVTPNFWISTNENDVTVATPLEPAMSTVSDVRFTDFMILENNNEFKPILSTSTEAPNEVETTTAENSVADILQNNIFLKNLFKSEKSEIKNENKIIEEPLQVLHTKIGAEPKHDKIPKFIQYHSKPVNDIKTFKKKPLDVADIINYVTMKNHFESSKIKSKSKPISSNNFEHKSEIRFIPIQQESNEESKLNNPEPSTTSNLRTLSNEQKEELRGIIKNYKVLRRNNNNINNRYDSNRELRTDLSPPPLRTSPNLPPLGRAGPSMKSYLPPIYV